MIGGLGDEGEGQRRDGGSDHGDEYLSYAELLILGTMVFEPAHYILSPRYGCAATVFDARRVLANGGECVSGAYLVTSGVLDTVAMTFARPRSKHAITADRICGCAATRGASRPRRR